MTTGYLHSSSTAEHCLCSTKDLPNVADPGSGPLAGCSPNREPRLSQRESAWAKAFGRRTGGGWGKAPSTLKQLQTQGPSHTGT